WPVRARRLRPRPPSARVDPWDPPPPGGLLRGREGVMVAAGKRLEWNQARVRRLEERRGGVGPHVGGARAANHAVPAELGAVEPVADANPAACAAAVDHGGEGGHPA